MSLSKKKKNTEYLMEKQKNVFFKMRRIVKEKSTQPIFFTVRDIKGNKTEIPFCHNDNENQL